MSNIGNNISSQIGSAKETIGRAVGSENLAAKGAAQHAAADTAHDNKKAQTHNAGTANKVSGAVQENTGYLTGNTQLENQGQATRGAGDVQHRV